MDPEWPVSGPGPRRLTAHSPVLPCGRERPLVQVHPCGLANAKNVLEIAVVPACPPHPETPWQSRPACVGYKDPFCLYDTFVFLLEDLILGPGSRGSSASWPCPQPRKFLLPITLFCVTACFQGLPVERARARARAPVRKPRPWFLPTA